MLTPNRAPKNLKEKKQLMADKFLNLGMELPNCPPYNKQELDNLYEEQ